MDKKERIVQAAIDVFKENGIERTKVSDIVKAAGIAQGTYYLYFSSKLSVMPAIAEELVNTLVKKLEKNVDKKGRFAKQLEDIIVTVYDNLREYRKLHALVYAGLASTEHLREWEEIYEPFYAWMTLRLEEAQRNEMIGEHVEPSSSARLVIGIIESSAEQAYLHAAPPEEEIDKQKRALLQFVQHALHVT
ncbi:TetR family transcriptional regulator [Geomicrobium sp. JSM 1781026]|uniref:TetR family transcriptional regulator n=1 Tax=Geomicrobium sp. JSM 1781026 TaxID=3344580 RepID=UPI0035C0D5DC